MMKKVDMSLEEFLSLSTSNPDTLNVIDFKASWCKPCKKLQPMMEDLVSNYPSVNFYQIDTDDEVTEEIVDHFNIKALPTIIYLKKGEIVGNVVGIDIQVIENTVNDNL